MRIEPNSTEANTNAAQTSFEVPARAHIDGKDYATKTLSAVGVTVLDISGNFAQGAKFPLLLTISAGASTVHVSIEAEVAHSDPAAQTMSCRFNNLNPDQSALFNRVLRTTADAGDAEKKSLADITTKDNFIRVVKQADYVKPAVAQPQAKKQAFGLGLATTLGLIALAFILYNIYQGVFTLQATDAMVAGPSIQVRAYSDGVFINQVASDALSVQPGQALATITPFSAPKAESTANETAIASPCDCLIVDTQATSGDYVAAGDKLISLVPNNAKPWILAEVEPEKASRILSDTKVVVTIAGSEIEYAGRVLSIRSGLKDGPSSLPGTPFQPRPVQVKIAIKQNIPVDFIGRPARVIFQVR